MTALTRFPALVAGKTLIVSSSLGMALLVLAGAASGNAAETAAMTSMLGVFLAVHLSLSAVLLPVLFCHPALKNDIEAWGARWLTVIVTVATLLPAYLLILRG